jgi:hypothetical protein
VKSTYKSLVEANNDEWRAFKALAAERGTTLQALLGELVTREVRADRRKKAQRLGRSKAAKQAMDKALDELRATERRGSGAQTSG